MKQHWHYSGLIPISAFFIHQVLQKALNFPMPLLDNYLDPFCLGALGIYGLQLERKWLFDQPALTKTDILLATLFLVIVSEIVFPFFSNKFVPDWIDAVSISLGVCWFLITFPGRDRILKRPV